MNLPTKANIINLIQLFISKQSKTIMKKFFMFLAVAGLMTFSANIASAQDEQADAAATETTPATVKGACTKEITLKHNQRLVFTDLDVGATYTVAETEDAGYTAAYVKTAEGTAAASVTGLSTNGTITEKDDSVAYTNTSKKDSKPTGILISNLPYIALALVAIGGLVAYVVVRRKADDEA